ncbi:MAG TPA: bifunctional serine/threonine-protein kinase/formylglycine-generating enzyme family protein, partial [Planctomycetota bacterium]|nr:bifunctional serine/threonine-protein kinase/formylglycine-generating enzyme family protein [Planctomycetota bacterium]
MIRGVNIGPYEVMGELGRGAMGVAYRARSTEGAVVAVKVLRRLDEAGLARFERERRLLGTFAAGEGFVPLLGGGATPEGAYLVMPLLTGGTLRDRLGRGPIGVPATVELGRALAEALGRAHGRGVVHRDLKPENVLFDDAGRPLLADLGIAKHFERPGVSQQSVSLSRTGETRGTAGYASPEQVRDSKNVGPPADVFALGAVLYECLTGRPAFSGEGMLELLTNVVEGRHEPLGRDEAPRWLAAAIESALAPDSAARPADGSAFRELLEPASWRRWLVALGVVALIAAILVAVGITKRSEPEGSSRPSPAPPPTAPSPPPALTGPRLPARLRPGPTLRGPQGEKIPVFLYRLPRDAGDLELVRVPDGAFDMGAEDSWAEERERPRHSRPMLSGYWIGRTPVTWGQYLAFCRITGHGEPAAPRWGIHDDHPVVNVSWDDLVGADGYLAWAGLALPSEAEWEKAARGTDGRTFPWGNTPPLESGLANVGQSMEGTGTTPVTACARGASPYGALDMCGNVWQWCAEWSDDKAYERAKAGDFSEPATGTKRALRGGCWRNTS